MVSPTNNGTSSLTPAARFCSIWLAVLKGEFEYEDWWQALDWVRDGLVTGAMLRDVEMTTAMPKVRPWLQTRFNPIGPPMQT